MKIVYDSVKRLTNIEKHDGFDFADLTGAFFEAADIEPAKLGRFKAVGEVNGRFIAVIFSRLGSEAVSVVSMRRANNREYTSR
jgi:uncharacterized DUF497 family protein